MDAQRRSEIIATTAFQTQQLGRYIGERLQSGTIIKLTGELGSGKTCFVQGLAQGLEVPQGYEITSPTYALIHEFPGRLPLVHADLYRLGDEMDVETIGLWDIIGPGTVVAVEWADRIEDSFWPPDAWRIHFQTLEDQRRCIQLIGYGLHIGNLINEVLSFWDAGDVHPSQV